MRLNQVCPAVCQDIIRSFYIVIIVKLQDHLKIIARNGEIQRIEKSSTGMVLLTKIFSDDFVVFVTSFIALKDGKITQLDEYYADYNCEVPKWRKDMNIGKPISQ